MTDTEIYENFVDNIICNELPDQCQKERLQTLADFLYELPEEKFDINSLVQKFNSIHKCGTVCCAIGWTPKLFPDLVRWGKNGFNVKSVITETTSMEVIATELFGTPIQAAMRLFNTYSGSGAKDAQPINATPAIVADSIINYLEFVKTL